MNARSKLAPALAAGTALAVLAHAPAHAQDVVIGVPNWPTVQATANIMKVIMEDNLGVEVELQNGTNPVIFEAMDKGTMHIHPEVWLPNQEGLVDQYTDTVNVAQNSAEATQGICVNQAAQDVGFADISDLTDPAKADLLDSDGDGRGDLFIGATGWASTAVERAKAKGYGYDQTVDLKEMDEGVAYGQLDAAQEGGLPWAGFCYAPHHLFTIHPDLVLLTEPPHDPETWTALQPDQDPQWLEKSSVAMAWPATTIQPAFAESLAEAYPQAASMVNNVDLTEDDVSGFAYALVVEQQDPEAFAREWVDSNPDRVAAWLQ